MSDADALPVPPVDGMIHRPDAPAHTMRIAPAKRRVSVDGVTLATSDAALRPVEIGRDPYPPTYYLPLGDVRARLAGHVAFDPARATIVDARLEGG